MSRRRLTRETVWLDDDGNRHTHRYRQRVGVALATIPEASWEVAARCPEGHLVAVLVRAADSGSPAVWRNPVSPSWSLTPAGFVAIEPGTSEAPMPSVGVQCWRCHQLFELSAAEVEAKRGGKGRPCLVLTRPAPGIVFMLPVQVHPRRPTETNPVREAGPGMHDEPC